MIYLVHLCIINYISIEESHMGIEKGRIAETFLLILVMRLKVCLYEGLSSTL